MSGVVVTGRTVREHGLEPMMDARAAGMREHRLMINPTPEVDSLVEEIAALRRHGVPGPELRRILGYCIEVINLNRHQDSQLAVGLEWADVLARDAENAARNQPVREPSIKAIADRLRGPLRRIREGVATAGDYWLVGDIIRSTSSDRLLGSVMLTRLGKASHGLLIELHAEAQARRVMA